VIFCHRCSTYTLQSLWRGLFCARWIRRRWATDGEPRLGVQGIIRCIIRITSPRPSPLYASRTHAAPRRAGALGIVVTYSPGPLAASAPRYMGKPTIHGQAHDSWASPDLRPEPRTRGWRRRGPRRRPCSAGEVDSAQNLRPRRSAHVVDAKEAVDPAPLLLEALADKHLIHPSQRRRVRPRGSLRTNFGYIHRGPVTDTRCWRPRSLVTAAPLRDGQPPGPPPAPSGAHLPPVRNVVGGGGLRRLPRPDGALVGRHPEIIRVGWRQRSQERSRRYEE
jgi:hypothetical protein